GLLRSGLAGVACALLAWLWKLPFPATPTQRWWLAFSGVASFAVWPLLLSIGLGMTTANHAALIIATIPLFTGLIAAGIDRVRPGFAWLLGVAIALAGTAILVGVQVDGSAAVGNTAGDLLILLGVFACAAGYVAGGTLAPAIGTLATTFWSLGSATLVLAPAIAVLWPRTDWASVSPGAWLAVGYMALFSSLIGYVAWFWALGRGGIARISAWQLGQPVLTVAFAAVLLGERLTLPLIAAGGAVLLGTALTQARPRR
ncbi:MAG TPA: DMT family transporter, partial [Vicinamibacterales bacterium]|nr:DMT family transporter [Vicinamibacterales bacterium]